MGRALVLRVASPTDASGEDRGPLDPESHRRVRGGTVREIPGQYPHPAPYTRQAFSFGMPLTGYRPGVYEIELTIEDQVAGTSVTTTTDFAVIGPTQNVRGR